MKKTNSIKATVYTQGEFIITIYEKKDMYEAWLMHKGYGIANHIIGYQKKYHNTVQDIDVETSPDEFRDMVEDRLGDAIIGYYKEHIMKEEIFRMTVEDGKGLWIENNEEDS